MSPTVLRVRGFRFYFFSREETRAHVHGLKKHQVAETQKLVEEHIDAIRAAWAKHFPG